MARHIEDIEVVHPLNIPLKSMQWPELGSIADWIAKRLNRFSQGRRHTMFTSSLNIYRFTWDLERLIKTFEPLISRSVHGLVDFSPVKRQEQTVCQVSVNLKKRLTSCLPVIIIKHKIIQK